jgi:predicted transcriptional regulator of viral defense system
MFNPLLTDMSTLNDQEIETKLTDLNKKYNIAMRMGNSGIAHQMAILIDSMRTELSVRHAEATKRLLSKQNKDLDDLIKVG